MVEHKFLIERSFIDTNILIYTDDANEDNKRTVAIKFVEEAYRSKMGVISTQVLQEYYVASTKKLKLDRLIAKQRAEFFSQLSMVEIKPQHIFAAINLHRLYPLSFWDSLILQAAIASNCKHLITEDLNHGQVIEGVKIVNPFVG